MKRANDLSSILQSLQKPPEDPLLCLLFWSPCPHPRKAYNYPVQAMTFLPNILFIRSELGDFEVQ